jgi:hypothetical protein
VERRASTGNSHSAGCNLSFVSTRRGEGIYLGYDTKSDEDSDSNSSYSDYDSDYDSDDSNDDRMKDEADICEVEEFIKPTNCGDASEIFESNNDDKWGFYNCGEEE